MPQRQEVIEQSGTPKVESTKGGPTPTPANIDDYELTLREALQQAGENWGESWTQNVQETIDVFKHPESLKVFLALVGELTLIGPISKGVLKDVLPGIAAGPLSRARMSDPNYWEDTMFKPIGRVKRGKNKVTTANYFPVLNAMQDDIVKHYGSWSKFKKTLAENPVRVTSDLAAIIPVGGVAIGGAKQTLRGVQVSSRVTKTARVVKQITDATRKASKTTVGKVVKGTGKIATDPGGVLAEIPLAGAKKGMEKLQGLHPEGFNPEIPDTGKTVVDLTEEYIGDPDKVPASVLQQHPDAKLQEARQYTEGKDIVDAGGELNKKGQLAADVKERFDEPHRILTTGQTDPTTGLEIGTQAKIARQTYGMRPVDEIRQAVLGHIDIDDQADILTQLNRETAEHGLAGISDNLIAKLELTNVADTPAFKQVIEHRERLERIDPRNRTQTGVNIGDAYENALDNEAKSFKTQFDYETYDVYEKQPIDFDADVVVDTTKKRRIYKILPRTMKTLEDLEFRNKGKLGKDLKKIREHIDEIAENFQAEDLSLLHIDNAHTEFRKDLILEMRNGLISEIGSGSKADLVFQAFTDDMFDGIEKQMQRHSDSYSPDLIERVRESKRNYEAAMFLENKSGGAAKFLRQNQSNPAAIVNKIVNGELDAATLRDLYRIIGPAAASELQASIVSKIFGMTDTTTTGTPNWSGLKKYLDPSNQKSGIMKDNPNRLIDILGGDEQAGAIAKKMNEIAQLKARFEIPSKKVLKGSRTAPFLERMQNNYLELIEQTLALTAIIHSSPLDLRSTAASILAAPIVIDILGAKITKKIVDSSIGRDWLLQGTKFSIPGTKIEIEWRDLAREIDRTIKTLGHQQRRAVQREKKEPRPTIIDGIPPTKLQSRGH